MKKMFYSIAVVAVATVALAMSSNSLKAQDEPQQVRIEDQTELMCDKYTLSVPEGWVARSRIVGTSCVIALNEPPYTTASPSILYKKLEDFKSSHIEEGDEALDDITIGDVTYTVFFKENNGSPEVMAATPYDIWLFGVTLRSGASRMSPEEVKEALIENLNVILESIMLK